MASESRQLPDSNPKRMSAIDTAKSKSDSTTLAGTNFLTPNTKSRLASIQTSYRNAYNKVAPAKNAMVVATAQKDRVGKVLRTFCSHFVQVFNLAIGRDKFVKEDRTFYKIDVNSESVPVMETDEQVIQVGKDLIQGETDRVAAGGTAMSNPDITEVSALAAAFNIEYDAQSTAVDVYDARLEDLDALNVDADKVIKKVWDEVETNFNEEDPASQRQNARQWGVVYVKQGSNKTVSGKVTDIDSGAALPGITIRFENGNKTVISGPDGSFTINTTLMDDQHLTAEDADNHLYLDYDEVVTLVENEDLQRDIKMKHV